MGLYFNPALLTLIGTILMQSTYSTMGSSKTAILSGRKLIDLRSDTVTRPTAGMYDAMMSAPVGDDVYGDDESVNRLELSVAELLGKEASLFVSSGTQSNLIAVLGHCARGDELITGDDYHIYIDEAGGPSVLGGIAMCALPTDHLGALTIAQVEAAIKPDDIHCPVSRLLCLENTVHGKAQSPDQLKSLADTARAAGLMTHLDGARLMNASVALGQAPKKMAEPFDSVSLCLSKGLGAPVGTVLSGTKAFIRRARRDRKLLGGGTRQAGILAAAGSYALDNHIERLTDDHFNAKRLAEGLSTIDRLKISQQTNMVFISPSDGRQAELQSYLSDHGIVISAGVPSIRLVVHLDVNEDDLGRIIDAIKKFYQ
jgi:threonine aldolase|tara:strand:+ start:43 stop:1155 length:1113 start_codon:yes stop_codon:yes gene_type:complete